MSPWPWVSALVLNIALLVLAIWSAHIPVLRELLGAAPLEREEDMAKCPEHGVKMRKIGGPGDGNTMYDCPECAERHVVYEGITAKIDAAEDAKNASWWGRKRGQG